MLVQERNLITSTIEANGAQYHGDLTKSVTHLIAAKVVGPKYLAAKDWNIKVVSVEWFHDSLKRGMVLDESLYNPTWPIAERGKGAVISKSPLQPSLKRSREGPQNDAANVNRRKLRRSASSKLNNQNDDLWAGMSFAEDSLAAPENAPWLQVPSAKARRGAQASDVPVIKPDPDAQTTAGAAEYDTTTKPSGFADSLTIYVHGFDSRKVRLFCLLMH